MSEETNEHLGRRDVLKRGAILGGAVVWTTPVVQSLAGPAFAASSPAGENCEFDVIIVVNGVEVCEHVVANTPECCAAIDSANAEDNPTLRFMAQVAALATVCSPATGGSTISACS